ncbi:MAG: HD domain-containing protein [Dehalococcoidia bacterium]|nr:HD domain-containing protein [Dehalococcoidia bacterium]
MSHRTGIDTISHSRVGKLETVRDESGIAVIPHPFESKPIATEAHIRIPTRFNPILTTLLERVNSDQELKALWRCANVNAVDRLHMADHGWVHVQIVANLALKTLRLLMQAGVEPSVVRHHGLSPLDAEVVVVMAALLHDVGMSIHRDDHERHSLMVASPKLKDLFSDLYDIDTATVMRSEVLHAILAHSSEQTPLTIEAGVVRVADALDMTSGRSRISFEAGNVNIHTLSAAAIERIDIGPGEVKAVRISIIMSNSAGLYQVDELLRKKLWSSGLTDYLEIVATIDGSEEKKLIERLEL